MSYITTKEAAIRWNVSERMIRYYCDQGRIPNAQIEDGNWYIPENASKPSRSKPKTVPLPPLLKKLIRQRDTRHYRGLYEYVQINMVYSSGRMASNRLTRNQVEMLFKSDKIETTSEPVKVNDIIETRNHFFAADHILNEAMKPLSQGLVLELQEMLISPHCSHKRNAPRATGYRTTPLEYGTAPKEIPIALNRLFQEYEKKWDIDFKDILDLHVRFERIRPFEDCNGRVGRLLMLKECLRHEITPFILDDKRRTGYLDGIRQWDTDRTILMDVCMEAQMRFTAQLDLQKLLEAHCRRMRTMNKRR